MWSKAITIITIIITIIVIITITTWYDLKFYLSLGSPAHHASVVARVGECCPGNVEAALGAAGKKVGSHAGTKI